MKIPFFDLKRQYDGIQQEAEKKVIEVMRSGQYVEGSAVKDFEAQMQDYIGVKHVITCGNGTDSLRIALQACGVSEGDEVITTAFSFFATAEAIAQVGAVPVFADIDEKTLNISAESARAKVTKKTKAILPVHIFGLPADMDSINALAAEAGVPVIEDACQAIGASYKGKKTGNLGTLGCFSFYPTKNLGGMGDGGMITTNDDDIAMVCRSLKAHAAGKNGALSYRYLYGESVAELDSLDAAGDSLYDPCKYYNYFIGGNSRLDSIQAAVLSVKAKHLAEYNKKRASIAERYSDALADTPLSVPDAHRTDCEPCWHQYAVLCDRKEELAAFLSERGIGTGAFYPVPLHLQKAFRKLGYKEGSLPVAESVCRRSICLPVFPEFSGEEVEYVIQSVREFFE